MKKLSLGALLCALFFFNNLAISAGDSFKTSYGHESANNLFITVADDSSDASSDESTDVTATPNQDSDDQQFTPSTNSNTNSNDQSQDDDSSSEDYYSDAED
ncbi:MAG: hypothetical protein Tsb005_11900 [Gammaproteobacteria bacterium]